MKYFQGSLSISYCMILWHILFCVGITELGIGKFQAKIGTNNHASLKLFQNKLAFTQVSTR